MSWWGVVLGLILIVSACTSNKPLGSSDPGASAAGDKPIEITFWYAVGGKIGEANENLVKKFNESQNKIHVSAYFQGKYDDINAKLQAAVVAKNQPDISVVLSTSTGPFATAGVLQDLTELAKRDGINFDNFTPAVMGNSYVNDRLYSFPYLRSPNVLFINATMFKEAGLDPAGPKT
jgi:sn-glycerol 3-phosphate transport system substrate-binding protein